MKNYSIQNIESRLYVCISLSTAPVGMHGIANGMYGLILVEPEGWFASVDKEYYISHRGIYTYKGNYKNKGLNHLI
jgi:nitrite reductase (NO-forming)